MQTGVQQRKNIIQTNVTTVKSCSCKTNKQINTEKKKNPTQKTKTVSQTREFRFLSSVRLSLSISIGDTEQAIHMSLALELS